jgi:subtilisin family serine protease
MSRRVRIGVIDSGVNVAHPHIGNIAGGANISRGAQDASFVDHLGHGTAVAALIHAQAPQAELFAVKIFQNALATNLATVLFAIDWCLDNEMDLINLSLGTTNQEHRPAFEMAIARVHATGKAIVSAFEMNGLPALPGSLPGVVGVLADASKAPGEHGVETRDGKKVFTACPFPREIPGVPREQNLHGVSFAVARVTAALASLWDSSKASQQDTNISLDAAFFVDVDAEMEDHILRDLPALLRRGAS